MEPFSTTTTTTTPPRRSPTPQDSGMLQSMSYDEAPHGIPPRTSLASNNSNISPDAASLKRPRSTPSLSPALRTAAHIAADVKRDSGISPSLLSTPERLSYIEANGSGSMPQATTISPSAAEPTIPAIVVQDGQQPTRASGIVTPVRERRASDNSPHAGGAAVRAGRIANNADHVDSTIDLGDLASDRIAFSKRGSILYSGKKMNVAKEAERINRGTVVPAAAAARSNTVDEDDTVDASTAAARVEERPKTPPAQDARKSNGRVLEPPSPDARVLSTEELTFSSRVRHMYEHGNESVHSWMAPTLNGIQEGAVAESVTTDNSTPEPTNGALEITKPRPVSAAESASTRPSPARIRASILREPNELAGGIEDWDDIDGQDVDRYGFIHPKRLSSRNSTTESAQTEGVQRVATRLRVQADQPRKHRGLRRNASFAGRSSLRAGTARNSGASSIHSTNTHRTFANLSNNHIFQSSNRRAIAEASDMLTLPPGLSQIAEQQESHSTTPSTLATRERVREEKWRKMAIPKQPPRRHTHSIGKGGGMRFDFPVHDSKLISRTWKGIPDRWRATAWHSFLSTSSQRRRIGVSDDELQQQFHKLQPLPSADDVQIDMDVPRTINLHVMFRRRYRGGQRLLFRVLHAISLYFPNTGYVQGMASLAATLLCYYEEEMAFVMLVRLWQLRGLEQLFAAGFEGLMAALGEFETQWLKARHEDVATRLEELGVGPTAYGTRWYLTLFNMSVPFAAQLRVWDVFMLLGDDDSPSSSNEFGGATLDVLHATSAALVDATRDVLLDGDFENCMKVLTSFVPVKDEDLLMRVAKAEWVWRQKARGRERKR